MSRSVFLAVFLASLLARTTTEGFSPSSSTPTPVSLTSRHFSTNDSVAHKTPKTSVESSPWKARPLGSQNSRGSTSSLPTKSQSQSAGLSRQEEVQLSGRLRTLRKVIKLRQEHGKNEGGMYILPSNKEWADACGTSLGELKRILREGQEARASIVASNIGLVTDLAKRHHYKLKQATEASNGLGTILTLQDLIQEGTLGLIKAAEKYKPEKGFRFSTYATYWIKQRILKAVSDSSRTIRLPAHVHGILSKVSKAKAEIRSIRGRDATMEEVSQYLEIPMQKLTAYTKKSRNVMSLEMPLRTASFKEDTRTLGDSLASDGPTPEELSEADHLRRDIHRVMELELADTERTVLTRRFGLQSGEPQSVLETAEALGITRDRVRLIEARALNKLRSPQRNYRLQQYVDASVASAKPLKRTKTPPQKKPEGIDSGRVWFF